jgi:hypothetical protein
MKPNSPLSHLARFIENTNRRHRLRQIQALQARHLFDTPPIVTEEDLFSAEIASQLNQEDETDA